jgi:RNA polymerase sigma-70 factor (ECF subfamily)
VGKRVETAYPLTAGKVTEAGRMLIGNDLTEISDDHLIMATLTGDDEAFSWLVARHKRRVFSLAARFARDRDELEDISQEVFIKAFENLKAFRHEAPFEHWLSRIAVRACYDFLRRIRREKLHTSLDDLVYELRDKTHEARQAAQEAHELLAWAMSKMRPKERLIITLLELDEKPVSEIAELTGWSESNVKVRAFRARQTLKTILVKNNERGCGKKARQLVCCGKAIQA